MPWDRSLSCIILLARTPISYRVRSSSDPDFPRFVRNTSQGFPKTGSNPTVTAKVKPSPATSSVKLGRRLGGLLIFVGLFEDMGELTTYSAVVFRGAGL